MTPGIPETYICPNCGTEVNIGSPYCPGCPPDPQIKWQSHDIYDGLDLLETPAEIDEFQRKLQRSKTKVTIISLVLLLIFIFTFVF